MDFFEIDHVGDDQLIVLGIEAGKQPAQENFAGLNDYPLKQADAGNVGADVLDQCIQVNRCFVETGFIQLKKRLATVRFEAIACLASRNVELIHERVDHARQRRVQGDFCLCLFEAAAEGSQYAPIVERFVSRDSLQQRPDKTLTVELRSRIADQIGERQHPEQP